MQQCLPSFIVVKPNVATNNIKQLSVAMETQELVPFALFLSTKCFVPLSTDLTYLGLHVKYPILLSDFDQI
jgi:hypothetical protein